MSQTRADLEQMGRAALLPGMRYMIEQMQRLVDEFSGALTALQNGHEPTIGKRGPGRPRRAVKNEGAANYWASMTPEERSAEMNRRMGRRNAKRGPAQLLPDRIGQDYTWEGAAKELGFGKASSFKQWRTSRGGAAKKLGRLVPSPNGGNPIIVFTEDEMNKLRKMRGAKARVAKVEVEVERAVERAAAKAAAKRTKKPGAYDGGTLPDMVDGKYTGVGAAKALGMKNLKRFNNWRSYHRGPRGEKIQHKNTPIKVYTEADIQKMRDMLAAAKEAA